MNEQWAAAVVPIALPKVVAPMLNVQGVTERVANEFAASFPGSSPGHGEMVELPKSAERVGDSICINSSGN
jgi:hypothetical protein